jgi:hypothetical protein
MKKFKSVETKYMEERQSLFDSLKNLDRRSFMKVTAAAMGVALAKGLSTPFSFTPLKVDQA